MKIKFKLWVLLFVALPALLGFLFGCGDRATNSMELQALGVHEIGNIVWTMNRSGYEPVQLIFNEGQFHGYDGCNWFGGRYEAKNDSIFPAEVAQTERACTVRTFPIDYLTKPFRMQVSGGELRIFSPEGTFTFKSDVTGSVADSPLVRNWMLQSSTDAEGTGSRVQEPVPTLTLNKDRTFQIVWNCGPENPFGCDEISGIFGIGGDNRILFYKAGWKTHAGGVDFVERVLDSTRYTVEADTLTSLRLVNPGRGTEYRFSGVSRSGP